MKERIAYLLTTYPSRSETFIHNEISLLKEKGLEVVILAAGLHSMKDKAFGIQIEYRPRLYSVKAFKIIFGYLLKHPLSFCRMSLGIMKYGFYNLAEALSLIKNLSTIIYFSIFLKKEKISHIHGAFLSWPGRIAYAISQITGLPYSLAVHARDGYVEAGAVGLKVRNAEFVICCSQAMTRHIQSKVNWPDHQKIHTVYHGVLEQPLRPENHSLTVIPTITAIGRFVQKKGFECLVKAFKEVVAVMDKVKLIFIGDGPEESHLKRLVQEYGIAQYVHFCGWLSHQKTMLKLSQSSILIVPSIVSSENDMDGIPNVILEAFRLKVPVIASRLLSIEEAIADEDTGLLFEPGNCLQLRDRIIQLLRNQLLREQIADRAYAQCCSKFNAWINIEKLYSLFHESK